MTPNVVSDTPEFGHGDTEDSPNPAPKARSKRPIAAMTNAPPITAPQATPEVEPAPTGPDWPAAPGTSTTTVSMIAASAPNEREKQDYRDWNSQKPK